MAIIQQILSSIGTVPITYRYLRLKITAQDAVHVALEGIEWLKSATSYPTSSMTSNTAPSPLVASADSEYSAAFQAWQAMDYSNATLWATSDSVSPHYHQIDLGSGNGILPTGIGITPASTNTYIPTAFLCYGSNTGAFAGEETLLYTSATGLTTGWTADTRRDFTF